MQMAGAHRFAACPAAPPPACRYELPWEDESFEYPPNLAPPQQILIDASNGASDYGNK